MTILGDVMTSLSATAIAFNLILLPLIAFKSGRDIGSYRVLLFLYSIVAIVHTATTLIMVPVIEPSEKGWLFYSSVPRVPRELGSYIICTFSTCYIILLLILAYSFLYRYFVMCAPHLLVWFQRPKKIIILVFIYVGVVACCAGPVTAYMRLNTEIAISYVEEGNPIQLDKIAYIGTPMYKDGHFVKETAYILTVYTIAIMGATIVCCFCCVKIIQEFISAASLTTESANFRRLQKRLFVLLILQTTIPFIFTFTPGLLTYGLAFLGTKAPPFISEIVSAFMPMAQLLDPILIFTFIGEYRLGLVNTFKRIVLRSSTI